MDYNYAISVATGFIQSAENIATVLPDGTIQAYWDSIGQVWTIGWGNTYYQDGSAVSQGDIITRQQADDLLAYVVAQKEGAIRPYVTADLNPNQYAALISLAYNCGQGNVINSQLLTLINSGASQDDITSQFEQTCVTSKGVPVSGLYNRRVSEVNLFFSQVSQIITDNPSLSIITGFTILSLLGYYIWRAAKMRKK